MLRPIVLTASLLVGLLPQAANDWLEPFPPLKIAGNLYYVGSHGLASYLITTPQGHIQINSDLENSVTLLRESIEKLGFRFTDVRILLISHAHYDHDARSAAIKRRASGTLIGTSCSASAACPLLLFSSADGG